MGLANLAMTYSTFEIQQKRIDAIEAVVIDALANLDETMNFEHKEEND